LHVGNSANPESKTSPGSFRRFAVKSLGSRFKSLNFGHKAAKSQSFTKNFEVFLGKLRVLEPLWQLLKTASEGGENFASRFSRLASKTPFLR